MATRVVLIDDHDGFRRGARRLLIAAGFDVVGEAGTVEDGVDASARLRPDAVLVDVLLPDGTGFDVAAALDRSCPRPRIVLVSSRQAHDFGDRLTRSPADSFVTKAELTPDVLAGLLR